jgi:SAM-dependent methyltransferase
MARKGYRGIGMEGVIARQYASGRGTESQIGEWRGQAKELTEGLPDGAAILEVAPGPGYFAIELARLGRFDVVGLDISHTFVDIAGRNAHGAGVAVDFRQGDAADMPFTDASFDLVVCQAAFKNFTWPARAIGEMHRVLRPGGTAIIQDLRRDAPGSAIRDEVTGMGLDAIGSLFTRVTLGWLRRRAYTPAQFERMAARSPFGGASIETAGVGVDVRMTKAPLPIPAGGTETLAG